MNREKRTQIFERLKEANPTPTTELQFGSTYQLLVAVILSAQATDISVNKATKGLFKLAKTAAAMAKLQEQVIAHEIKSIGLYKTKAKNVLATSQILVDAHGGEVPKTRLELEALPGVGRKTANVILNTAFGEPTIAVDTHIFRVANRTRMAIGSNVNQVEKKLLKNTPTEYLNNAHHWILLHGRYICKARTPECQQCAINDLCEFRDKKQFGFQQ